MKTTMLIICTVLICTQIAHADVRITRTGKTESVFDKENPNMPGPIPKYGYNQDTEHGLKLISIDQLRTIINTPTK